MRAILSGANDTGIFSVQPTFASIVEGSDLLLVAVPLKRQPFLIVGRKGINSLEDLYGKNVGTNGPGAALQNFVLALYRAKGLDPNKLNFVNIGNSPLQVPAILAGKIDAGVIISSDLLLLRDVADVKVLVKGWDVLTTWLRLGMPIHRKDMNDKEKDEVFRVFFIALSQGYRWCLDNKVAVVKTAVTKLNMSEKNAGEAFDDAVNNGLLNPDFAFTEAETNYMQKLNVDEGQQKEVLPFDKVADLRYVKAIKEALGEYKPKGPS